MRVLVFSNEAAVDRESGSRLFPRTQILAGALSSLSHEVFVSLSSLNSKSEIPEQLKTTEKWTPLNQVTLVEKIKPDIIFFSPTWKHCYLKSTRTIPIFLDLQVSEFLCKNDSGFIRTPEEKLQVLSISQGYIVPTKALRHYFAGWLVQAGRVISSRDEILVANAYLPEKAVIAKAEFTDPCFLIDGSLASWEKNGKIIWQICQYVTELGKGRVIIIGSDTEILEQGKSNSLEDFVRVRNHTAPSRLSFFSQESIEDQKLKDTSEGGGVLVFSGEGESLNTPPYILEALFAALPALTPRYSEFGDLVENYDAGWTFDETDDNELRLILDEIFSKPKKVEEKGQNALNLAKEKYSVDAFAKDLSKLLSLSCSPISEALKYEYGKDCFRPWLSPWSSKAEKVEVVEISAGAEVVTALAIIPDKDISGISINIRADAFVSEQVNTPGEDGSLEVNLVSESSGRRILRKEVQISSIPSSGDVFLKFPIFSRPKAGEVIRISLRQGTCAKHLGISVLRDAHFPVLPRNIGSDALERYETLYIKFKYSPGISFTQIGTLGRKCISMIISGEWHRLYFAVSRRLRGVTFRLRKLAKI